MIIYSRPSTSGGHIPHCVSQSTCALCFLITGAKVLKILMQTKLFNSYFSSFLEMLNVKKYFIQKTPLYKQSKRYCQAIYEKVRQFLHNSRKLSTRFCRTTPNALLYTKINSLIH